MSGSNRTVLISGASIAGPALAYWLHRYGFSPTIVERAPAIRDGGYAIDVRGAAVDAVDRMGLLTDIRHAHTDMRGLSFVDASGRTSAQVTTAELAGQGTDTDVELMRGHLSRLLYRATKSETEYLFDDSVSSIQQTGSGVRVTFERSAPRTFDLVVGADGLHSNVRALAFGDEARFRRYIGRYISIFSVPNHLGLDRWSLLHNTPGRLAGLYVAAPHTGRPEPPRPGEEDTPGPSPEAKAILGFTARRELPLGHRDTKAQYRVLEATFAGAGWEVPKLLDGMRAAPDFYFDSISQIRMDHWSQGRVVLLGDAGYGPSPLSGQGTSLALVGAYVLAGELAAAGGEHRTAFARYEAEMREFVRRNQAIAGSGARALVPKSRPGIWLRDRAMRLMPALSVVDRMRNQVQSAANAITLKDYGAS